MLNSTRPNRTSRVSSSIVYLTGEDLPRGNVAVVPSRVLHTPGSNLLFT